VVGEDALRGFEDDIGDGGGFVHQKQDAAAKVVHPGKGLSVPFGPRNHIDLPLDLLFGLG
jgi:hypothetical protein